MTTLDPAAAHTAAGATPQPGWYPDPQDPNGATDRWWNGAAWSEHIRRRAWAAPAPAAPASAAGASRMLRNGPAWWSLGLGLVSLGIVAGVIVSGADYVWLSTSGVFAVLNGVRALRLRSAGLATALAAPIIGIVSGSLGTMLMLLLLLVPIRFTTFVTPGDTFDGSTGDAAAPLQQTVPQAPSGSVGSAAAAPAPTEPLQAQPPSALPDDQLTTYTGVSIHSVTSASAGCGVLTVTEGALPLSEYRETEARHMQDWLSLESQSLRSGLQSYVKETKGWPSALDEDPQTRVLFTKGPGGSCDVIGPIPKNADVRYAMSPDRGQVAIALYNSTLKVGTLWRSVDDTMYWL